MGTSEEVRTATFRRAGHHRQPEAAAQARRVDCEEVGVGAVTQQLRRFRRGDPRCRRLAGYEFRELPEAVMGLKLLYVGSGLVGLAVFAFGSIGVMIAAVPDMRYETAMWFILAAGLAGAAAGPLFVHWVRARR